MSKSHAEELSRVYASLFEDFAYAYPTLRDEFDRDQARLAASFLTRGIGVYYSDLPKLGKHFDRCLSQGAYKPSQLALSKCVSSGVQIPRFLRGLYLRVFEASGAMKENYDVQAICFIRQAYYLAKKAREDCSDHAVRREVGQFVDIDSRLPSPESYWAREDLVEGDVEHYFGGFAVSGWYRRRLETEPAFNGKLRRELAMLLVNLDKVSGLITSFLGPYDPMEWRYRHGPGAISDPVKRANKYAFSNWSRRLEREFPYADVAFHSYAAWARRAAAVNSTVSEMEPCSKLIAVPKTYDKPRLIASEPSEHQWCQQSLRDYMYSRVGKTWVGEFIRFRDQTLNQALCRRASEDGALVTLDLSAASDRVSCHFVGNLFRGSPKLLNCLQASRTSRLWIPSGRLISAEDAQMLTDVGYWADGRVNDGTGTILMLKKFSTMGSACTFPVESLGFLAIALAAVLTTRQRSVCVRNILRLVGEVSVFGDDIIVPEDCRELLCGALELLDFKVNLDKSFWTGRFRESCGLDAYAGVDVTPAYWHAPNDGKPEDTASTINVSNNFYRRFLVRTAGCIARTVRGGYPLVPVNSGVLGLTTFVGTPPTAHSKRRWNRDLQRWEVKIRSISARVETEPLEDETALLQFFTEQPDPQTMWQGGVRSKPKLKEKLRWVPEVDIASSCGVNFEVKALKAMVRG